MNKPIMSLAFGALFLLMSVVAYAATLYPYDDRFDFGTDNIRFLGNLEKSGLTGVDDRWSVKNRHDLRFYNVHTGQYTPGESEYLQTVQYDIQPNADEPPDKFNRVSGYHVVPLNETLIKDLASKANGNPDYVWGRINSLYAQAESSPQMWVSLNSQDPNSPNRLYAYRVQGQPYLNIGAVFYLSGGGDPQMVENQGGDGINSPIFHTTAKITNWPVIQELKQNPDGSIKVKATAYSIFDTTLEVRIAANGNPDTAKPAYAILDKPVSNYGVTYEGNIPLSAIYGLKPGENEIVVRANDIFGRFVFQKIKINVTKNICQPILSYKKEQNEKIPISFTPLDTTLGYSIDWRIQFDSVGCIAYEATSGDEIRKSPGKVTKDGNRYFYSLASWEFLLHKRENGVEVENVSNTSRPLVLYLMNRTGERIRTISLNKGERANVSVSDLNGSYHFYAPAPTEVSGDWDTYDLVFQGFPAKNYGNYPSELISPIQQLVEASQ
ncbi:hypothetical protein [Brevibacillus marinus]|uniref:hypothetical protein n=1 Tax=Brevibacillus marinus TaxID=2496837 RepID=UPI000F83E15D|nr:hypothetical protein [Brevibacillus marinus]